MTPTHADEVVTDPTVFRLRTSVTDDAAVFAWDYPGRTLLEVAILRSAERAAAGIEELEDPTAGQGLAYLGVGGSFRDPCPLMNRPCHYTVFARRRGTDEGWASWGVLDIPAPEP